MIQMFHSSFQITYRILNAGKGFGVGQVNVRCTITSRVSDLMSQDWTIRFISIVNKEVLVQFHSTIDSVNINLQKHGAFAEV